MLNLFKCTVKFVEKCVDRIRNIQMERQAYYFIVATVIGVLTGICAALLKIMIGYCGKWVTSWMHTDGFNWWLLSIPLTGILLTGIYQRYVLKHKVEHGVEQVVGDLAARRYNLGKYWIYAPMIASTFTLGFGGSAGSEGPIATTGAAIGSNVGRKLGLSSDILMVMVGCGAGAGIAGIFKAPIGGMLFTLEVLKLEITTMSVMALLLACTVSALTAYVLSGCTVDLSFIQTEHLGGNMIWVIVGLGLFCGFYSTYYSLVMERMRKNYEKIRNPWWRNIASGAMLSIIVLMFPAMYGEGYNIMGKVINGDPMSMTLYSDVASWLPAGMVLILLSLFIIIAKPWATSASNCGGGVAGDFAPTLFAGCFAGFFFASALKGWFGVDVPVSTLAFVGMAGVMAGAIRAPFMALFLTAEMTNSFALILPLFAVCTISYGVVRLFRSADYYRNPYGDGLTRLFGFKKDTIANHLSGENQTDR